MIEINNLVKKYGDHVAVDNLSMTVEPGKIYGLLGPNGAGKSTTMNIVTGYIGATSGTVKINGYDIFAQPEEAKKCVGYLPELPPLYQDMTVLEYLKFVAELKKLEKSKRKEMIEDAMEMTQVKNVENRLIKNLSKGYKQRVGFAQAILGFPEIIILDEPTVGLDPKQIIEIRELIKKLAEKHTVILSSHILTEISAVCDHVFIISKGKLVASDSTDNLINLMSNEQEIAVTAMCDEISARNVLKTISEIASITFEGSPEIIMSLNQETAQISNVDVVDGGDGNETVQVSLTSDEAEHSEISEEEVKSEMVDETVYFETYEEAAPSEIGEEAAPSRNGTSTVSFVIKAKRGADIRANVFKAFSRAHITLLDMHATVKSLEDVFLELTGEGENK